jgi:hypothetical protein
MRRNDSGRSAERRACVDTSRANLCLIGLDPEGEKLDHLVGQRCTGAFPMTLSTGIGPAIGSSLHRTPIRAAFPAPEGLLGEATGAPTGRFPVPQVPPG